MAFDENKLIEKLWEQHKGIKANAECYTDVEEVADEICNVVSIIEEQPKVGEWIPCSERLPENYETVNITWVNRKPVSYYEHIKDKPFTGTAIFHYGKWYWYSCVCEDYLRDCGDSEFDRMDKDIEVIAWQPLPEPYKE